jgi:hypothetical protein
MPDGVALFALDLASTGWDFRPRRGPLGSRSPWMEIAVSKAHYGR